MIAKRYRHLPKNSRSFRPQAPTQDLRVLEVKENSAHQLPWLHYIMLKMHQTGACKEVQMRRRNRTAFLPAGFLCQTCPHPHPQPQAARGWYSGFKRNQTCMKRRHGRQIPVNQTADLSSWTSGRHFISGTDLPDVFVLDPLLSM